jgi:hypothetical protein
MTTISLPAVSTTRTFSNAWPKGRHLVSPTLIASVGLLAVAFAGCASMSDEERARIARVRIVNNADSVRGCQPIGSVTDDDMQDLQKKAARLGGDIALVTMQSQGSRGAFNAYGGGYRSRTYTTAEVYRCEAPR